MLVGTVVEYEIHDDADIALLRFRDEFLHICHCAIRRIDATVIGNIVTIIDHRRGIDRCEPDSTRAEGFQVIKMTRDTRDVTNTAACRVLETFRIDLVDNAFLPPFQLAHENTPFFRFP